VGRLAALNRKTGKLPRTVPNAMLHVFSGMPAAVGYRALHYRQRSEQSSTLLDQLVSGYRREGAAMPYTMADFKRDYILEHFPELTEEERRKALQRLSPEERLRDLSPEEIESYLQKLRAQKLAPKRKPRRKH
jgi:hypothetical protein